MPSRKYLAPTAVLLVLWTIAFTGLATWDQMVMDTVATDPKTPRTSLIGHARRELVAQGVLWLMGVGGILAWFFWLHRLDAERERVVTTLRKSRHDLASVLTSIDDLVFGVDARGRVEPLAGLAGLARAFARTDQVAGRPLEELLPADTAMKLRAALSALDATGQTQEIDYAIETGDRLTYWNARISRRFFDDGTSPGAIVVMRDVTRRSMVETALRDSEEKWRLVYELANEGILINHLDGTYVAANRAACEMLGMTEAELLARGREIIAEPSRSTLRSVIVQRERHGVARGDLQLRRKDGTLIDTEGSTSIIQLGDGQPRAVTVFRDVTASKRAEEKALNYALRWETALEAVGDGLWDWDKRTGSVFFSPGWKAMRGYADDEIGNHIEEWSSRVHPEDWPAIKEALAAHHRGETPLCICEYRTRCKDGTYKWILDRSRVIERDEQGAPVRMVGMHRDMTEPRRAQEAIQAAVKQLEHAQRVAQLGSYTLDIGQDHWTSSPMLDELFGIKKPGFAYTIAAWRDLVHPADREAMQRYFEENVVASAQRFDREYRIIRLDDGRERWVHGLGELTLDAAGRPQRMFGTIQDVTERKHAELELRKLSSALEQSPVTVIITDPRGTIEYVNPSFLAKSGYSREEVIGQNPRLLNSHTRPPEIFRDLWQTITAGREWRGEFHNRRKNGELYWESGTVSPIFDENGAITNFLSVKEDITERKAAETRMREHAELLDVTQDAIFVLNPDQEITFINRSAEILYGVPAAEAIGRRYDKIVYRELPIDYEADVQHLITTGTLARERRQRKSNGEEIIAQVRATLVRDEHGRGRSVLIVITDITEARRLEAHYLRAQRLESLGSLASGVAHDLNNVLTPILVAVDLLQPLAREPQDREIVRLVGDSARRGADIVRQLLLFGRGSDTPRAPVDVGSVLRELERMMQETFPKNISRCVQSPPRLWLVEADRTQLHQVLLNLAVNARDAMPRGGTLTATAGNVQVDEAFAQEHVGAKPGPHVAVRLTDTGTGIPPEHLDKIFDPFFTTKPTGQGTGLGLATVLGITRSHGGFVTVETQTGSGTTFTVFLPAAPSPTLEAASTEQRRLIAGRGELVLLVDDESHVRSVLKETFVGAGYRVITTANGAEALAMFARHTGEVRLVISDQMMPIMDGHQLIHALWRRNNTLPALLMSGMTNSDTPFVNAAGQSVRFLPKPFLAEAVLREARELIDEAAERAEKWRRGRDSNPRDPHGPT